MLLDIFVQKIYLSQGLESHIKVSGMLVGKIKLNPKGRPMRVSMGLRDRRKTAKNLVDSRKN